MVITLEDIRNAAESYVNTKVTRQITVAPFSGNKINIGEEFSIKIKVTNPVAAQGGFRLTNVRYYVRISNDKIATFRIPPTTVGVARNGLDPNLPPLPSIATPSSMYLFPVTDLSNLDVADTDEIQLFGRAIGIGTTQVKFRLFAMPDMNYLLGKDSGTDPVNVVSFDVDE